MTENEIIIRKATKNDAQDAWLIRNASIRSQCAGHYPPESLKIWTHGDLTEEFIAMVEDSFYVATLDYQVVGIGMIDLESGKVDAIFVHPDKFKLGLGKRILSFLENLALESGLVEMNLEATLNAVGFYRACGFEGDEMSIYHSPKGVSLDCVPMKKRLHK